MTKRIFRPFWSYDVQKTENWLHDMSLEGYHLKKINTITRMFIFEESNSAEDIRYHIEYAKSQSDTVPAALENDGWERIIRTGRWYILSNTNPPEKILTFPVRDGIIHRNRLMMYLFSSMSVYTLLTSLLFIIMLGFMLFLGYSISLQPNTFWITALIIGLSFWALAPYSTIKLYKTNHKYW